MADVELVAGAGYGDVGQAGFRIVDAARQRVTVSVRLFGSIGSVKSSDTD